MSTIKKLYLALAAMIIIMAAVTLPVSAATASQDGLEVTVSADQESYSDTDSMSVKVTLENTNDFAVSNVFVKITDPSGYELTDNADAEKKAATLKAGKSMTLQSEYEPQLTSAADTQQSTEESAEITDSASENAESDDSSIDAEKIFTIFILVLVLLVVIILMILGWRKHFGKKLFSLLLCGILAGSVLGGSSSKVLAAGVNESRTVTAADAYYGMMTSFTGQTAAVTGDDSDTEEDADTSVTEDTDSSDLTDSADMEGKSSFSVTETVTADTAEIRILVTVTYDSIEDQDEENDAEEVSLDDIYEAYLAVLEEEIQNDNLLQYFIYDMNSDGIPELFYDTNGSVSGYSMNFYTFTNGQAVSCGTVSGNPRMKVAGHEDGIEIFESHMGTYISKVLSLKNNKISSSISEQFSDTDTDFDEELETFESRMNAAAPLIAYDADQTDLLKQLLNVYINDSSYSAGTDSGSSSSASSNKNSNKKSSKSDQSSDSDDDSDDTDDDADQLETWKSTLLSNLEVMESSANDSDHTYSYYLINVDGDGIPEVLAVSWTSSLGCALFTVQNDQVVIQNFELMGFSYIEGENLCRDTSTVFDTYNRVYQIQGEAFVTVYEDSTGDENDSLQEVYDTSRAVSINGDSEGGMTYDEMVEAVKNY